MGEGGRAQVDAEHPVVGAAEHPLRHLQHVHHREAGQRARLQDGELEALLAGEPRAVQIQVQAQGGDLGREEVGLPAVGVDLLGGHRGDGATRRERALDRLRVRQHQPAEIPPDHQPVGVPLREVGVPEARGGAGVVGAASAPLLGVEGAQRPGFVGSRLGLGRDPEPGLGSDGLGIPDLVAVERVGRVPAGLRGGDLLVGGDDHSRGLPVAVVERLLHRWQRQHLGVGRDPRGREVAAGGQGQGEDGSEGGEGAVHGASG